MHACGHDAHVSMLLGAAKILERMESSYLFMLGNMILFATGWLGNSRWVDAMVWSGQKDFVSAPSVPFKVDGAEAGLKKSHGLLTFLEVHNASHMVPIDQPKASLEMIKRWMQGIPL